MSELEELNPLQKKAVYSPDKQICVIAGPGCGKTKTLVAKIIYLVTEQGVNPAEILILTFSKRAIKEVRERVIRILGLQIGLYLNIYNFHSFCYKFLRKRQGFSGLKKDFPVYDRDDQESLLKRVINQRGQVFSNREISDLLMTISLCKVKDGYLIELEKTKPINYSIYSDYQQLLLEEDAVDFNDLLIYSRNLLKLPHRTRKDFFANILVDEFQDVNDIQWEIVNLLKSPETQLFVVGDPNQSIYGFQGSSSKLISLLLNNDDWKITFLSTNYRSTGNIVDLANSFLQKNQNSLILNQLSTIRERGVPVEIIQNCPIRFVVRKILYLVDYQNIKPNSIAVIYRNNYLASFIEKELIFNGIPCEVLGSFRFMERKEIKDIISYLKLISFQSDISFLRVLKNTKGVGARIIEKMESCSREADTKLFTYFLENIDSILKNEDQFTTNKIQKVTLKLLYDDLTKLAVRLNSNLKLIEFISSAVEEIDYFQQLEQRVDAAERKKNIKQFLNLAKLWETKIFKQPTTSLKSLLYEFLQYCTIGFEDGELNEKKINLTLSSVHQAKGLEFEFVFFIYLDNGILPSKIASDLAEEKRIFYVGITRAKSFLYLVSNTPMPSSFLELFSKANN